MDKIQQFREYTRELECHLDNKGHDTLHNVKASFVASAFVNIKINKNRQPLGYGGKKSRCILQVCRI